jgi:hypothetical protein
MPLLHKRNEIKRYKMPVEPTVLYQISVKGPSELINGPHQGEYQHEEIALAYVDHFGGTELDLVHAINQTMLPLYGSDWNVHTSAKLGCVYTIIKTTLGPSGTVLTSEKRTVGNFKMLTTILFGGLKEEKAKLEARLGEINKLLL